MKIASVSDLHVESSVNRRAVAAMSSHLEALAPDVLLVLGDLCNGIHDVGNVLAGFDKIGKRRIYVPGNHELWSGDGDARATYYRTLPEIAAQAGFEMPIDAPVVVDHVACVGTMGWYDGTFADPSVDAARLAEKEFEGRSLLDRYRVRWRSGSGSTLGDCEIADMLLADLRDQLAAVPEACGTIIGAVHVVPHPTLLGPRWERDAAMRYFRAFQGSSRLGDALASDPRVRHVFAGHNHERIYARAGGISWHLAPLGNLRPGDAFDPSRHVAVVDVD